MRAHHVPLNLVQRACRERLAHEDQKETGGGVEKPGQREKLGRRDTSAILGTRVRKVKWEILDLKDQLGQLDLREPLGLFLCFVRPHVPGGTSDVQVPVISVARIGIGIEIEKSMKQHAQLDSIWLDLVTVVATLASTAVLLPKNFFLHYFTLH